MSNPPAGWYPDPTGQPNTLRWWNGTQWTNKTEKEDATPDAAETTASEGMASVSASTVEAESEGAAISAAEKAKSTWMEPAEVPSAANHWTQQPPPDEPDSAPEPFADPVADPAQNGWTLKLADAAAAGGEGQENSWTHPVSADSQAEGWGPTTWTQQTNQPAGEEPTPPADGGGDWVQQETSAANTWGLPDQQQTTAANGWGLPDQQTTPANTEDLPDEQQTAVNTWGLPDEQAVPDQSDVQTPPPPWQPTTQWEAAAGQQAAGQWQSGGAGQWPVQQGGGPGRIKPANGKEGKGGGSKVPLIVAAAVAFVLVVGAGVFFLSRRDDKTAGPDPTPPQPTNTSSVSPPTNVPTTPGTQTTGAPGQSKNPKLHEAPRVASEAISFPRQGRPWSERKRLIAQLINSSGQYVRLQEKFDGKNDWYADMFVGALGTGTPFNGDPQATASDLMLQARSSMYGDIPVTFKPRANGPVKRSGKAGWFYQQSVTVNSTKVTSRVLTLTVAVFDLGDGTAVAYISDIPVNRPDLRTAESQVYKGINVG